jgi:hypothetical protein
VTPQQLLDEPHMTRCQRFIENSARQPVDLHDQKSPLSHGGRAAAAQAPDKSVDRNL